MVINQPAAMGDILFCEPIFRHFWQKNGDKPIVPLRDHLMFFADYIDSATFVPMSKFGLDYDSIDTKNPDYLSLRFANPIVRNLDKWDYSDYENTMPDKYILARLPLELWKTLQFNFFKDKMISIFKDLNLDPKKEDYIFVNEHSQAGSISINPKTNLRVVKMECLPGYNVLDWLHVMLHAKEHYHISTSTFYMLEALKNLGFNAPVFMYPRPGPDGLKGISKLNPTFKYTECYEK